MDLDEPRFDLDTAADIAGITSKCWTALERAGAPVSTPDYARGGRYVEGDLRVIAVIDAIGQEFDLKPREAVAFWNSVAPDGKWPAAGSGILNFSIDEEVVAILRIGPIAARIARRILAHDLTHNEDRLAGVGDESSPGSDYLDAGRAPRIARPAAPRQTFFVVPANRFHPARLARTSIKEPT